jgi:hypothetical protein
MSGESTVDIMVVIDAESLINDSNYKNPSQNYNKPTPVTGYIFMIAPKKSAIENEGNSELTIQANVNDNIYWRVTSLSRGNVEQVMLYNLVVNQPANPYIDRIGAELTNPNVPIPDPTNPSDPTKMHVAQIQDYYWVAHCKRNTLDSVSPYDGGYPGYLCYTFRFAVYTRDNKLVGYFSWDPFIKIID